MNYIKLINTNITGSGGLKLLHGGVTYSWKNLVSADPGEGFYGNVETQFSGWENPTMNLLFHIPTGTGTYDDGSTWMSWSKWNQIAKNQYLGTEASATSIVIAYNASDSLFADYSASSSTTGITSIPIQIRSYSLTFSPDESRGGYLFTINAQIQVTK
jgi:hypothetical protein